MAQTPPERPPDARGEQRRFVLLIGVGNSLRRDDATGLEIARRGRARAEDIGIAVAEHEGESIALLDVWDGADAVVLVDAIRSGAAPGTIHRVDATSAAIPTRMQGSSSTHAIGIGEAIELARALHRLPARIVLFGVEGHRFTAGTGLSAEVEGIAEQLLDAVLCEARDLAG